MNSLKEIIEEMPEVHGVIFLGKIPQNSMVFHVF